MNQRERMIVVMLICLLLVWLFYVSPKLFPPQRPTPPQEQTESPAAIADEPMIPALPLSSTESRVESPPLTVKPIELTSHLRNGVMEVELTSHGAGVKTVTLYKYQLDNNGSSPVMLRSYGGIPALALGNFFDADASAAYEMRQSMNQVVFERLTSTGVRVRKTFELDEEGEYGEASEYLIKCRMEIIPPEGRGVSLKNVTVSVGTAGGLRPKDAGTYLGVDWHDGSLPHFLALTDLQKLPVTIQPQAQWIAVKNQYFTMVLTPRQPAVGGEARVLKLHPDEFAPAGAVRDAVTASLLVSAEETLSYGPIMLEYILYAGPKEYRHLRAMGKSQEEVLQFGRFFMWRFTWMSALCKLMLIGLVWIHEIVRNWGVAIIVLTTIIRLIFWPVTGYGARQMKKMQALQPEMKKLQEKYGKDMQKFQIELQKLYKHHKVHPMGGCLPALIQIPFMIAFWSILISATELWNARFLWIQDLSRPDSLFMMGKVRFDLMLLLMGASQFWQAWLMPSTDSNQRMIGLLMPVAMIVMMYMWDFSSALVLYWTVGNLFTILQTYLTHKPTQEAVPAIQPPSKSK